MSIQLKLDEIFINQNDKLMTTALDKQKISVEKVTNNNVLTVFPIRNINELNKLSIFGKFIEEYSTEQPKKLDEMFKTGFMVDCSFLVGPHPKTAQTLQGHKLIFAMESPVFEQMLCGNFKEAKNSHQIRLPEDDVSDFKQLRNVLYSTERTSTIQLMGMDILGLYKLSQKYLITSVSQLCIDCIKEYMKKPSTDDLILIYAFSKEFNILVKEVEEVVSQNRYPLCSHLLIDLKLNVFTAYIAAASKLNNSSLTIFEKIESYLIKHELIPQCLLDEQDDVVESESETEDVSESESETENVSEIESEPENVSESESKPESKKVSESEKCELLKKLLKLVNFSSMDFTVFIGRPSNSVILSWKQKFKILSYLYQLKHRYNYGYNVEKLNIF